MAKDQEELVRLIKVAQGERSLRQYASDAGVNPSTLSRILAGKYFPGIKILMKLTSSEAQPRGGITLNQLLEVADIPIGESYTGGAALGGVIGTLFGGPIGGFVGSGVGASAGRILEDSDLLMSYFENVLYPRKTNKNATASNERNDQQAVYEEVQRLRKMTHGLIYQSLGMKGICFQSMVDGEDDLKKPKTFISVNLIDQSIKTWIFDFRKFYPDLKLTTRSYAQKIMERYCLSPIKHDAKLSIVLDDVAAYEAMLEYQYKLPFRGNLSVILVDLKKLEILKEDYISFYDVEADENSMLKLV